MSFLLFCLLRDVLLFSPALFTIIAAEENLLLSQPAEKAAGRQRKIRTRQKKEKRTGKRRRTMEYQFYGWEHADVPPVKEEYKSIRDPRALYDLLSRIWCAGTCAPRMREDWSRENKTLGQCSITAFLAQDIFGGKVFGILRPGGNYHCYNVIGDCVFDLTSEQFGDEVLDYSENPEQFREVHFAKEEKRLRYEYLKAELARVLKQQ